MRTIRGANPLRFEKKKKNKVTTDRRCIFLNVESIGQPYRSGRDQFRDQRIEIDRVGVASDSCINENRISTCYVPSLRLEGFMGEPREILTRSPLLGELVGLTNGGFFLRVDDKRPFTPYITRYYWKTRGNWNLWEARSTVSRGTKGRELLARRGISLDSEIKIYENYSGKIIRTVRLIGRVRVRTRRSEFGNKIKFMKIVRVDKQSEEKNYWWRLDVCFQRLLNYGTMDWYIGNKIYKNCI